MSGLPGKLVFLGRAQKKLAAQGTSIFTYHKIGPAPPDSCDPFLYTHPGEFDRQLTKLVSHGLKPTRLGERSGPPRDSAKRFVVTFDDGFCNVLQHGLAILARHNVPAIQFIVSGFIGKRNEWDIAKGDSAEALMDAAQIKEWLAAGHEIGSHSVTHANLKRLSAAEAREEIFNSKKSLEDTFGLEVRHFCYPFGGWTPTVQDLVAEAGYQTACTTDFGVSDASANPFELRRIIPLSGADLVRKIFHRAARRIGMSR